MSNRENKEAIKRHVEALINDISESMKNKIDSVLASGAVDVDEWDPTYNFMLLPKAITCALLAAAANERSMTGEGTNFAREQKKTIKNIQLFV